MSSSDTTQSTQRPRAFESYGVLGAILAQAAGLPSWDERESVGVANFGFATIALTLRGEAIGNALAECLDLSQTGRSSHRARPLFDGHDTTFLQNVTRWEGIYAKHTVCVQACWDSPLGDLDLAEGEELA